MLGIGLDLDTSLAALSHKPDLAHRHDQSQRGLGLPDDHRVFLVQTDAKRINAAVTRRDVPITQIQAEEIGVGIVQQPGKRSIRAGAAEATSDLLRPGSRGPSVQPAGNGFPGNSRAPGYLRAV